MFSNWFVLGTLKKSPPMGISLYTSASGNSTGVLSPKGKIRNCAKMGRPFSGQSCEICPLSRKTVPQQTKFHFFFCLGVGRKLYHTNNVNGIHLGIEESEEWKSHLESTVRMPLDLFRNLPEALKTQASANSLATLSALSRSLHCLSCFLTEIK